MSHHSPGWQHALPQQGPGHVLHVELHTCGTLAMSEYARVMSPSASALHWPTPFAERTMQLPLQQLASSLHDAPAAPQPEVPTARSTTWKPWSSGPC
ncbi:MAG TPA: hypothetical protein VGH63_01775, partial [Polyangia bacterium]